MSDKKKSVKGCGKFLFKHLNQEFTDKCDGNWWLCDDCKKKYGMKVYKISQPRKKIVMSERMKFWIGSVIAFIIGWTIGELI